MSKKYSAAVVLVFLFLVFSEHTFAQSGRLVFSCDSSSTCQPDHQIDTLQQSETLWFVNQTSDSLFIWSLPDAIFTDTSSISIAADDSVSKAVKWDAPLNIQYGYEYSCKACPGENQPGTLIVEP